MNLHYASEVAGAIDVRLSQMFPDTIVADFGKTAAFMSAAEARELATKLMNAAVQAEAVVKVEEPV